MRRPHPTLQLARIRGVALFEVTLSLGALVVLALVGLKASLIIVEAQRWTISQSLSDAYLTREVALAGRVPFSDLDDPALSPFPTYPASTSQQIEVGRLPGAIPVSASLVRTKYPANLNLISRGGTSYSSDNPMRMETWLLKSFLTFKLGGRNYVKSRTTVRVR